MNSIGLVFSILEGYWLFNLFNKYRPVQIVYKFLCEFSLLCVCVSFHRLCFQGIVLLIEIIKFVDIVLFIVCGFY